MRWLRILNVMVILALVGAAAFVYKLKFESTLEAEQVASLRAEIRRERDAIAGLRAEWAKLDNPDRIQTLAKRHLTMRPIEVTQFDDLKGLPPRPVELAPPGTADPIASIIESTIDTEIMSGATGSLSGKP